PCAPARAVISVEKIFSTLGIQQTAPFPMASMPQEGSYSGYQAPPRPPLPSAQSNTGSGSFSKSNPQQMTQPIPQSGVMGQPVPPTTQDSWGRTGSGVHDQPPIAPNRAPLFIGLGAGALLFIGMLGVGGYLLTHRAPKEDPQTAQTGTSTTPPPPPTTLTDPIP